MQQSEPGVTPGTVRGIRSTYARRRVSFSEVAFITHIVFPPCCSLLLVTYFTTTRLQCAYHLPEEAFTNRHDNLLIVGRDSLLQAVTLSITAYPLKDRE